jgi:hypothetical protein
VCRCQSNDQRRHRCRPISVRKAGNGVWGLLEWYPNRSFKKKARDGEESTDETETTEPEQLSKPTLVSPKQIAS